MKKLLLLFSAIALLSSCKKEDVVTPSYSIEGVWKPVKMVDTQVEKGADPISETFIYDACQQQSRWTFNADKTGNAFIKEVINNTCVNFSNENFSYTHDPKTGQMVISYLTYDSPAKASNVKETTMNLKVEELTPTLYHSKTYTLVKVAN